MKYILAILVLTLTACESSTTKKVEILEQRACIEKLTTPTYTPADYRCINKKVYKLEKDANLWLETEQGCLSLDEVENVKKRISNLEKQNLYKHGYDDYVPGEYAIQAYLDEARV